MSKRVCSEPGCPSLIDADKSRCTTHERALDRARGTRQQRGYDTRHDQLRARWQLRLDAGDLIRCWRCTKPIDLNDWTLGHCDDDRTVYHGPECAPCNLATAGRQGCTHHSHN